jgi:predicted heme/steroid binding protein
MNKKSALAMMALVCLTALLFAGCGSSGNGATGSATASVSVSAGATQSASGLELTADELAKYNGKDGQPAYIAVDGVIYDVTNVPQWKNGGHNGYTAGKDLTEEIKTKSPHGLSKLNGVPVVGKLK